MARKAQYDHRALAELLSAQQQVISRSQSLGCGLSAGALRHRTRPDGPWRVVLPGVYLVNSESPSTVQREVAASLYAGNGSVITGAAALYHHGMWRAATDKIDMLVPAPRRLQSIDFARIRRTTRLPKEMWTAGGMRYAPPPRAVADAVSILTAGNEVRAIVADAVQRRLCTITELTAELSDGPVRGSSRLRQALAEVVDGVRSVAEGDLRKLLLRGRIPMPCFNARLFVGQEFLAMPDAWWPDKGVVVEVDSREWHLSPQDWERTMRRHAEMSAQGIIVLHFSPRQITHQPDQVLAAIRKALESAAARPLPFIRTIPAS